MEKMRDFDDHEDDFDDFFDDLENERLQFLPRPQERLEEFTNGVHNIVSAHFNTPSLYAFIAILICLEHSFWLTQQGSSPTVSFTEAWDTYLKDKRVLVDQRLENYLTLKHRNDWFTIKHSPSDNECTEFQKIVLDNLLSHPKHSI